MPGIFSPCSSTIAFLLATRRKFRIGLLTTLLAANAITTMQCVAATPVAGDNYVYRIVNGYNNETRGQTSYCVEQSDAARISVAVTNSRDGAQSTTKEIYAADGNWLRHTLSSHDQPVEYEFSPAYPAYDFPLAAGKRWSTRVNAVNPATGALRSVRVDATVLGSERIRVPAGEFDTIRINRSIYAGDAAMPQTETTIVETEWYAPALGRSVRTTTRSIWLNLSKRFTDVHGDWSIQELLPAPVSKPEC